MDDLDLLPQRMGSQEELDARRRYSEAGLTLRDAFAAFLQNAGAHAYRALYQAMGERQQALQDYQDAQTPAYSEARTFLGGR